MPACPLAQANFIRQKLADVDTMAQDQTFAKDLAQFQSTL